MLASLKRVISNRNFPIYSIIAVAYLILSARFFYFIYKFTANILFWDQWEMVDKILHWNLISLLFYQHNEHRIGVGLIITKILESSSKWDNRVESITIGLIIFLASLFALLLKKKLTKNLEATDVIIPFLFLSLYQWESIIWGFQIAFVLPLLFLLTSLYLFTLKDYLWRNFLLLVFVFLSTYSSFHGIFLGGVVGLFFLLHLTFEKNLVRKIVKITFSLTSIAISLSYFINYAKAPFLGKKVFDFIEFSKYIILEINSFIGFIPAKTYANNLKLFATSILLLIIPLVALISFAALTRFAFKSKAIYKYFPVFSLYIFSALFAIATAYGRLGLGVVGAASSRYTTYMAPLYFGMYLTFILVLPNRLKSVVVPFLVLLFVFFASQNNYINYAKAAERRDGLNRWKTCYLQKQDVLICNKESNYLVFPKAGSELLKKPLEELKRDQINLYNY